MKHYTNKKTNETFGYESFEVAKEYNDDYENLVEMSDEQFIEFRDNRPKGGRWTYQGWVIDEELLKEEQKSIDENKITNLLEQIKDLNQKIQEHLLFDEKEEAKKAVLEKRKLEEELNELKSKVNS